MIPFGVIVEGIGAGAGEGVEVGGGGEVFTSSGGIAADAGAGTGNREGVAQPTVQLSIDGRTHRAVSVGQLLPVVPEDELLIIVAQHPQVTLK